MSDVADEALRRDVMANWDDHRSQCCPMDTYGTDSAGNLRVECTCGDNCECMCADCICASWGEEYEDE